MNRLAPANLRQSALCGPVGFSLNLKALLTIIAEILNLAYLDVNGFEKGKNLCFCP